MTPDEITQITAWLAEARLHELELTGPGTRLKLTLDAATGAPATAQEPAPAPSLTARAIGIFLTSHPWRDAPLVQPGERIVAGQLVALLQVSALLQPVAAPADGIVGRCLATPGELVGFGTPLLEFIPDDVKDRSSP